MDNNLLCLPTVTHKAGKVSHIFKILKVRLIVNCN